MKCLKPAVGLAAAFLAAGFLWMDAGGVEPRAVGRGVAFAAAQDTAGEAIFKGKGLCHVCHGADATGTPLAPNLTDDVWLNTDGSVEGIIEIVTNGVPQPKEYPAPMPARGGADLSEEEVAAVAQYVSSLSEGAAGGGE